jgi:hypothetical protein
MMGDYAEDALRSALRAGLYFRPRDPNAPKHNPKTHSCPVCGKMLRGADAVKAHMKAKPCRPSGDAHD